MYGKNQTQTNAWIATDGAAILLQPPSVAIHAFEYRNIGMKNRKYREPIAGIGSRYSDIFEFSFQYSDICHFLLFR